ncbi:MAG: DUF2169 domain-containing protein [Gemmatimonadales bacterium]|jgi:hypothetical protein
MWQLVNETAFAAERSFVRDREGAEVWIVAVKATFTVGPDGTTELAKDQERVLQTPRYLGEPGRSSLLYESDMVYTKVATDVILHGRAYARGGRPAVAVEVALRVGKLSKALRVLGDRRWEAGPVGLRIGEPEPFQRMPIVYERAFGGSDDVSEQNGFEPRNPIGTGFATAPEHLIGRPLPNVEEPGELITSWKQRPRPAGFGPIAPHWSPRRELAGTYDERWERERLPLMPVDFDDRFYCCAPEDQQVPGFLRGGEPVELHNLTAGGLLRFPLPRVYLAFATRFGRQVVGHSAALHTVIVEPDHPRVIMVWHTSLPCHNRDQELEMTRITQKEFV